MPLRWRILGAGRRLLLVAIGAAIALAAAFASAATYMKAWGDNTYGVTNIPTGLTNAVAIALGGGHALALQADGTVEAWGVNYHPISPSNYVGQAIPPEGLSNVIAVAAGYMSSLALRSGGDVVVWGGSSQTNVPAGVSNVVSIAAQFASLALKSDGTVVAWGSNTYGLTNVPADLSNVVAVAVGGTDCVAVRSNGLATVWGWNGYNATNVPAAATNLIAVQAGLYHILGLRANGTVIAWGYNGYGQTNIPSGLSNVVAIAAGSHHNLALKEDGTIVAWGYNNAGQRLVPAGLSNVVAVSASGNSSLALANDGSPWILRPPASVATYSGRNASFNVKAIGRPGLSYQWQFDDHDLAGATNATLVLTNVQGAHSGSYRVVVSNGAGVINSSAAMLNVMESPPILLDQPASVVVALSSNVSLSVTASGSLPLTYQWRFGGTNLTGATNAVLTLMNAQWNDEGNYAVVVSNAFGSVASSNAFLNVADLGEALNLTNVIWTTSSGSAAWIVDGAMTHDGVASARGGAATFYSPSSLQTTVTGPGTLTFWTRISGSGTFVIFSATSSVQSAGVFPGGDWLPSTVYLGGGQQTLRWISYGSMAVDPAARVWLDEVGYAPGGTAPFLGSLSTNQAVRAGTNATFSCKPLGTPPLQIQWRFNGFDIPAATNASFSLTNVQSGDAGAYSVRVTNDFGSFVSNVSLTVIPTAPIITTQPSNQVAMVGSTATFQVVAQGSEPMVYQWQFDGVDMFGATNPAVTLEHVPLSWAGVYRCVASNAFGTTVSASATLVVLRSIPQFDGAASAMHHGSDGFGFTLRDLSGHGNVVLYASSNLLHWEPIFTNAPVLGVLEFLDAGATNSPMRFYRAKEE